jgi:hypothetical protein
MSQRDFNQAILEAQGVSPSLAAHIVGLFEEREAEIAALKAEIAALQEANRLWKLAHNIRNDF